MNIIAAVKSALSPDWFDARYAPERAADAAPAGWFESRHAPERAVAPAAHPVKGGMEHITFFAETSEHAATLAGGTVTVFRKGAGGAAGLTEIGAGRWEGGIIVGSGVNCGILVRLEPSLRAQSGTP